MNINQPPNGYAAQLSWCVQAIQTIWRRLTGISGSGGGGTVVLPSTYVAYGNTSNEATGSNSLIFDDNVGLNAGFQVKVQGNTGLQILSGAYGIGTKITARIGGVGVGTNNTFIQIDDEKQKVTINNVPIYANDAAAMADGLTSGMVYKTTVAGITFQCIVP